MVNLKLLDSNSNKLTAVSKKIRAFIDSIIDEGSFVETDVFMSGKNFLDGSDALGEGVITGYGSMSGYPVCVIAQNPEVLKGSLSKAHADKMLKCIKRAIKTTTPLISIIDSAGARIGEGVTVLEGYAEIIAAAAELKAYVPHIAIVKGNSIGLMSCYTAMADFVMMSDESVLSFNAPLAVIASANSNAKATAMLGADTHSKDNTIATFTFKTAKDVVAKLTSLFEYLDQEVVDNSDDPNRTAEILNTDANVNNVIAALADDSKSLELYADFGTSVKTVFASVNSIPVGIVATNADNKDGKLCISCIKKIKKFVKLLDSYNIPLITLVDSQGVVTSLEQEKAGLSMHCAKLIAKIATADITKIAVITNQAIGYAYTALASKALGFDYVLAFANATIAPVSAEIAVTVCYNDDIKAAKDPIAAREKLANQYATQESNPFISAKDGYIDNIIEPALIRPYVASAIGISLK